MKKIRPVLNFVFLTAFGLACVQGLMQIMVTPYQTVKFDCEPRTFEELLLFGDDSVLYPASPSYIMCPKSE